MTRNRAIRIRGGGAVRARGGIGGAALAGAWIIVVMALIGVIFWVRAQPDTGGAGRRVVLALPPAATERTEDLIRPVPATEARPAAAKPAAPPTPQVTGGDPLPVVRGPDGKIALAPAPDPGLLADTANGPLPVVGPDGRRAWRAYARPFTAPPSQPRIAIVIEGLGMSEAPTTKAIEALPGAVTLSFVAYTRDLQATLTRARAAGHETLIEMPMEPYDYPQNDPGPSTLRTDLTPNQNIARLEEALARGTGYVGVMNYLGAKFIETPAALTPVLQSLNARGLMFFDSHAFGTDKVRDTARATGIPFASSDLTVDANHVPTEVDGQLAKLAETARRDGQAIGVAGPYPVTIERIAAWANGLEQQGIALAPLTALARQAGPAVPEAAPRNPPAEAQPAAGPGNGRADAGTHALPSPDTRGSDAQTPVR